jgi:hypothetical protein
MKPGDLVTIVDGPDDTPPHEEVLGLHGIIVEPVTLEDGHPINSWCDWWVLVGGELQPWAEGNLEVISEAR